MVGRELAVLQKNIYLKLAYRCFGTLNVGGQMKHVYLKRAIEALALPAQVRILDAGCGTGLESFWLARRFPHGRVTGLEMFPDQIQAVRKILQQQPIDNFELVQGDLTRMEYENEFDLVYCSAVLEHVEDDQAALENMYRCLKPGGVLLLDVPLLPQYNIFRTFKKINAPLSAHENALGHRVDDSLVTVPSRKPSKSGLLWGPTYAYAGIDHAREGYEYDELYNRVQSAGFEIKQTFQAYGLWFTLMWELHEVLRWWNLRPIFFPVYSGLAYLETLFDVKHGNKIHVVAEKGG